MSFGSGRSRNILQHPANGGAACGSIAEVQNCSNECVDWPLAGCVMLCSHWIRGFVHLSSTFLSFCTVKATCSFSCLTVLTLQRSCIVLLSYLQGQWGSWGSWSSCPVSCGGSTQNRSRIQLVAQAGRGLPCEGIRFVLICLFSPTAIALGSSAIVKVSGQNCFRTINGSLGQICVGLPKGSGEGSTKVLPWFHQGFAEFVFQGSTFVSQMTVVLETVLFAGFRQMFFTLNYQSPYLTTSLLLGWHVSPISSYPQKTTHHVVAVGVFFGFIVCKSEISSHMNHMNHMRIMNVFSLPSRRWVC